MPLDVPPPLMYTLPVQCCPSVLSITQVDVYLRTVDQFGRHLCSVPSDSIVQCSLASGGAFVQVELLLTRAFQLLLYPLTLLL